MIPQNQKIILTKIGNQPRFFIFVQRYAFVIVIAKR